VWVFGLASLLLTALLLDGCGRDAGWYPVPPQQSLDFAADPGGIGSAVNMQDGLAADYIVRDIGSTPGAWRWTFLHPELRFRVRSAQRLHFTGEIAIAEATFRVTGPVTIAYFIDGRRLGAIRCDHPAKYEIDEPVPAGWIQPNRYVHVRFEADRHWTSPDDGAQLSFLLFRAGFQQ
jgi:hypothetical protein